MAQNVIFVTKSEWESLVANFIGHVEMWTHVYWNWPLDTSLTQSK